MLLKSWKFKYVDNKLLKVNKNNNIFIYSRSSTILSNFLNKEVQIHNGLDFKKLVITPQHFNQKFGGFSRSRQLPKHKKKTK